jgi:HlyD family secretion protein
MMAGVKGWSRVRWLLVAGLVAAAGIATAALSRGERTAVGVVKARRAPLVVPVLCLGTLEPPAGGVLQAPAAATVAAVLVVEGDRVEKGTPLVRLDDPDLAARAAAARAELQQAREASAVAEAERDGARREAAARAAALEADARLLEKSAIARSVYEADEIALRQAEVRLRAAEARIPSIGGDAAGGRTGAGGPTRLALAAERARDLDARVAALTVRAPFAGAIYGLPRRAGTSLAAGDVVARIADPEQPWVTLDVDPADLPRVGAGQRIVVTFDGLPDESWEGHVTGVAPALHDDSGRAVARVTARLADPRGRLPFNASVNARIVVGEKPSALLVPRAALQRKGERRFVYVDREGRAAAREVSVGLVGLNDVEIESGLAEGDSVLLPGEVSLSEGLRVAPARP